MKGVYKIEDWNSKKQIVADHLKQTINELEALFTKEYFDFNDWYFAGGCVYSLWNNREIKDYDLFCKNKKAINKLRKFFRQNKGLADIVTKNAISMGKYQFIVKHIGEQEAEVNLFDFKHNMFWYDASGLHNLVEYSYLDSNKLEFNSARARDVLNIVTRIPKFIDRGMEISQKEILDNLVAFRSCVNGKISAGVMREIKYAQSLDIPVLELPSFIERSLSVEDTRQMLIEVGVR